MRTARTCLSTMQTWKYTSSTVDIDGQDVPLPSWINHKPPMPPSSSVCSRQEVVERVIDKGDFYDVFTNQKLDLENVSDLFKCNICLQFLFDPVVCTSADCQYRACLACTKRHHQRDIRCPICRKEQPGPEINRHVEPYLAEQLQALGVAFHCNLDPPGSHDGALFCCRTRFDTLKEFKRHVALQGSFHSTRIECRKQLRSLLDPTNREKVSDDRYEQLRYIDREDAVVRYLRMRSVCETPGGSQPTSCTSAGRPDALRELGELYQFLSAAETVAREGSQRIQHLQSQRTRSRSARRGAAVVVTSDTD